MQQTKSSSRLEAFSDAIWGLALTFLVIRITGYQTI
ncbi:hypothetical protein tinsulaeT_21480 [Thalassotalea insulae]|uniref:DUF1211 domain-containing protein n=1 Tax=Thalassotalea insulae TaxID=2056778 RepID=A0ABQ6GS98_9GAMM|nr:hypothetical protein tinsulaeT_21480 [Thalassotalea insulae]